MSSRPRLAPSFRFLTALVGIALLSAVVPSAAQATDGGTFVVLTNEKRASVDLPGVTLSAAVDTITAERAAQMARNDTLAHDLAYVQRRLADLGVCWKNLGEIIAWEKGWPSHSYQRTVDSWWASTAHHAIMAGDFNAAGGAWKVSGSGATYSVMVFIKACGTTSSTLTAPAGPSVIARSPAPGATGVGFRPRVRATFSEAVRGVDGTTFVLHDVATGKRISASVSYDAVTHQATLLPAHYLWLGRTYRVTLRAGIHDADGNALERTGWRFTVKRVQWFSPERRVAFDAGQHVGFRFDRNGTIIARKAYTLSHDSGAPTSKRALIPGHSGVWYYITAGVWAGYWVRASSSVRLQ